MKNPVAAELFAESPKETAPLSVRVSRMPLFKRKPHRPTNRLPAPDMDLPDGEAIEYSEKATLLHGTDKVPGALYMTNRRLIFQAQKGEAKWMIVPYTEVREAGLYRWHHAPMGRTSLNQCLCLVTTKGEQVWYDFNEDAERAWLPLLQAHLEASGPAEPAEG